jgi:hypothetical protein
MNSKFGLTILAAIVALVAIVAGLVAGITVAGQVDSATPLVTSILGFVSMVVVSLLTLLRTEDTAHKVTDTANKISNGYMDTKIKSNVKTAMAERAEEFQLGAIPDDRKEDTE